MKPHIPDSPLRYRLAIIGEGPSEMVCAKGRPFADSTYLQAILGSLGLPLDRLFLGYVSTKWSKFPQSASSEAVQAGLADLAPALARWQPHCCLLLGNTAFKIFGGGSGEKDVSIYQARGTIFKSPQFGAKCVGTYDPGEVMRNYSWNGIFKFDVNRAREESEFPTLDLPRRQLEAWPTFTRLVTLLRDILARKPRIAFDLEGWPNAQGVTCYSISESPLTAFIVPFRNMDGSPFWSKTDEELEIWQLTSAILSDPTIEKVCQNGMYELFVFAWRHKILVRGIVEDTMFKQWERFCEYPKGLGFIASFFTKEPYYKDERTTLDLSVHHEYCCKDSCVTLEAAGAMDSVLTHEPSRTHYNFNIRTQKPYLFLTLRGCKMDLPLWEHKKAETWGRIQHQQIIVNEITGRVFNVKSHPLMKQYLYNELGLPPQYKLDKGEKKLTSDMDALGKLIASNAPAVVLELAKLVRLRTRLSDLNKLVPFPDGRMRCNYNPVGTDTGRLSSSETSIETIVEILKVKFKTSRKSGTTMGLVPVREVAALGTNLQNVTKDIRDLFIPESTDYSFFQYDLAGADAWTVGAELAVLGNDKMLVHLRNGIKPSITTMLLVEYGNKVYEWDLETLKKVHDAKLKYLKSDSCAGKDKNGYTASKKCQHGCVTADHEVLTRRGWIPIDQLVAGVEILTWKNNVSQWEVPSKLTRYDYTGELHTFKGTAYDLVVTHDHRMPFQTNGTWKECNADAMFDRKAGKLPVSGTAYQGFELSPIFTKLLAAFQSDGCIARGKINFHFRKQRKIDRLIGLLNEAGILFDEYSQSDGTTIIQFNHNGLIQIGKETGWQMLGLSSSSMKLYLEETLYWDGSVQKEKLHSRSAIYTAVQVRAEVINTMAHMCGFGSQLSLNVRVSGFGSLMHNVSLNQRTLANRDSLEVLKEQAQDVPVYCVTVPAAFFYVRRNSKIMVTGNTNYGMQAPLMCSLLLKDELNGWIDSFNSGKETEPLDLKLFSKYHMERNQRAYREYYGLELREEAIRRQLTNFGYIDSASGHRRHFMSIRNRRAVDDATVRVACSHSPQGNTTYATNAALVNLYYDLDNRTPRGNLRCEPTLMIHDALAGQAHKTQVDWAKSKMSEWFHTPLNISGIELTIPVEGNWGPNWKVTG